ncbi:MAG: hypothetical protein P8080_00115 [Gammaproteobacteria bacterium]
MHGLRRHRRSLASLAASLFLAVWASMAVAPCLMAAEVIAGGDCPHCPEPPPPCHDDGGATSDCTYVDGYDFDGRDPSFGLKDPRLAVLPVSAEAVVLPEDTAPRFLPVAMDPPDPGGPRLHLKNCILLD